MVQKMWVNIFKNQNFRKQTKKRLEIITLIPPPPSQNGVIIKNRKKKFQLHLKKKKTIALCDFSLKARDKCSWEIIQKAAKPGSHSHCKAKENKEQEVVLGSCLDNQTDGLTAPCLRKSVMFKLRIGHRPNTGTLKSLEECATIGTLAKHCQTEKI